MTTPEERRAKTTYMTYVEDHDLQELTEWRRENNHIFPEDKGLEVVTEMDPDGQDHGTIAYHPATPR